MSFANAGIAVTLIEINDEALERGLSIIDRNYAGSVKRGKLSEEKAAACRALITGSTDYASLAEVDLVIEAVFEDPNLKKEIFARLDKVCKPGAILATNTSYQDVDAIAAATQRPQDVVGMHFFSPAHIMKLLEVVRGKKTADDVLATCMHACETHPQSAGRFRRVLRLHRQSHAAALCASSHSCCCSRARRPSRSMRRWKTGAWRWGRYGYSILQASTSGTRRGRR